MYNEQLSSPRAQQRTNAKLQHTTRMSEEMKMLSATADALQSVHPQFSRDELLKIAAGVLGKEVKVSKSVRKKTQRVRKTVDEDCRCCARVWGTGSGEDQCTRARQEGSDYCKSHSKKVAECGGSTQACQLDSSGKRKGLFMGDIREPVTGQLGGLWVITWNNPDMKAKMAAEKKAGTFQYHPWAPNSGKNVIDRRGKAPKVAKKDAEKAPKVAKKVTFEAAEKAPKVAKKVVEKKPKVAKKVAEKAPKVEKKVAEKKPRAKNPYMFFLSEQRKAIKAELEAESGEKVTAAAVTKEAGARWKKLGEDARAPYKTLSEQEKAEKDAAWEMTKSLAVNPVVGSSLKKFDKAPKKKKKEAGLEALLAALEQAEEKSEDDEEEDIFGDNDSESEFESDDEE